MSSGFWARICSRSPFAMRSACSAVSGNRLGHTSVRMADEIYVNLYDDTGRSVAQAISDVALSWPSGKPSDSTGR